MDEGSICAHNDLLMIKKIKKIGLIQNAPLPGDFPNNLRAIVQGYRECLDHGADIVIAPAAALCGIEPCALANRTSFINQTKDALENLSRELGSAPLILAAYTRLISDDELYIGMVGEEDDVDPWMEKERSVQLVPYLLEKDSVTELENSGSVNILNTSIYTDTSDDELLPDADYDIMVRMPCTPWYASAAQDDEETRRWEASMAGCTMVCCRAVGANGSNIYGGGSGIYSSDGDTLLRLPFFETAAKVIDITKAAPARHLPQPEELMAQALERGIRDNVRNNGFIGICIPLDSPNSALLGALCVEALGAGNVCGISFEADNKLAEKLGITSFNPDIKALLDSATQVLGDDVAPALTERLKTMLAITHAESRGMMLGSPLGRRQIMLGDFCTYGQSGGHLAPLGNLYDVDIYLLSEYFKEKYDELFGSLTAPEQGTTNRIIHELTDRNTAASQLLDEDKNYLFKENDVRFIQRKLVASALKRTQLPVILHVDAPDERNIFPLTHRLND